MTVLTFPNCPGEPTLPGRESERESVVLADVVALLTDAAARLPADSEWRAWLLRHASSARHAIPLIESREGR